eukprot:4061540-Alexandrium_andersonii.AAC.1
MPVMFAWLLPGAWRAVRPRGDCFGCACPPPVHFRQRSAAEAVTQRWLAACVGNARSCAFQPSP